MSIVKMEEDFTERAEKAISDNTQLAQQGKLNEALETLLALEKQTRMANDVASTTKLCGEMVKICGNCNDWKTLNNYVVLLSKRRGQLKQAITRVVQEAMTFLDKTPDLQTKLDLIDTLRTVSAGKMYVEVERARLSRTLAKIREDEGKLNEAAEILQEVQVETMGSMEKREKIEFILEQMRLCLDKGDYVRAQIVSRKITARSLADPEVQDLKIRYHEHLIRFHAHEANYFEIFRSYRAMFDTPLVADDKPKREEVTRNLVLFLVMSPFSPEQLDIMMKTAAEKVMDDLPLYKTLLKRFIGDELILWSMFESTFGRELSTHPALTTVAAEVGKKRSEDLKDRITEHNIRTAGKYYSRISTKRLSELLSLDQDATERFVSRMVSDKMLYAKIDRIEGVVSFARPKDSTEVLNDWSSNITQLLSLVERSCHLINKENMIHKIVDA